MKLALIALLLATTAAQAGDIEVRDAWLRATPKNASVAGGYATIVNHGGVPDTLVAASLPMAPDGQIHEMSMANGVMHMGRLPAGLAIPPGATVTLTPGHYHLMFEKPSAQLKAGQTVVGSLTFAKAGKVDVTFAVAGLGATQAPGAKPAGHDMHDMPGMKM